jgi:hypothetical protein
VFERVFVDVDSNGRQNLCEPVLKGLRKESVRLVYNLYFDIQRQLQGLQKKIVANVPGISNVVMRNWVYRLYDRSVVLVCRSRYPLCWNHPEGYIERQKSFASCRTSRRVQISLQTCLVQHKLCLFMRERMMACSRPDLQEQETLKTTEPKTNQHTLKFVPLLRTSIVSLTCATRSRVGRTMRARNLVTTRWDRI